MGVLSWNWRKGVVMFFVAVSAMYLRKEVLQLC